MNLVEQRERTSIIELDVAELEALQSSIRETTRLVHEKDLSSFTGLDRDALLSLRSELRTVLWNLWKQQPDFPEQLRGDD